MEDDPHISILTLVHNNRPYIEQTIECVMNQTCQDWEWIIVDDGSTDGTGEVIKEVGDTRVRYVFQENRGFGCIAENFNKALFLSRGRLIAMLEGDDYWPAYKLEVQRRQFDDPTVVLSYGECCLVDRKGEKIGDMPLPEDPHIARNDPVGSSLKAFMHLADIGRYFLIHDSTVMIRRETLVDIGGFVEQSHGHQDIPTWTRLALEGRFAPVPLCLGLWRRHPVASTFAQGGIRLFDATIDFFRRFIAANEAKLKELGFPYTLSELEDCWTRVRDRFLRYYPYNRAMTMLSVGSFEQARAAFREFLHNDNSPKARLTYALVVLSSLMHRDLVHPVMETKNLLGGLFFGKNKKRRSQGRVSAG